MTLLVRDQDAAVAYFTIALGFSILEAARHVPYGSGAVFADLYGNHWDLLGGA